MFNESPITESKTTEELIPVVTPENPFMSPAWIWTGPTVFQKIYPSLMFFDGQTLTFVDSQDNVLMQLEAADVAGIKYNNTLIIIRFNRPMLDSKKMIRIMFYGYGSSNFTVPSSYAKQYQSFIERCMSVIGPEETAKISDNKPSSHYGVMAGASSVTSGTISVAGSAYAAYQLFKIADAKDNVALAWGKILSSRYKVDMGHGLRRLYIASIVGVVVMSSILVAVSILFSDSVYFFALFFASLLLFFVGCGYIVKKSIN